MPKFLFRLAANLAQLFQPKLNILIYHRIMPESDPLRPWEIDAHLFRHHLEWISGVFNVIPLSQAVQQIKDGTLRRRSLVITFDDGYLDNATVALPILQDFNFHATFFCTSAWLDGGLMWNDQVIEAIRRWPEKSISIEALNLKELSIQTIEEKNRAIETILSKLKHQSHKERQEIADSLTVGIDDLPDLMMRPEQIKLLYKAGMDIGGHSHSHPIIASLASAQLKKEINQNKATLEKIINKPIRLFSYPNGKIGQDYTLKQSLVIKNFGYDAAVSTDWGTANKLSNLFQLKRFTPWNRNENGFIFRLIQQCIGSSDQTTTAYRDRNLGS